MMSTVARRQLQIATSLPRLLVLTVIGRDQLVLPMVGLTARNSLLPVDGTLWQLVWPVHPVNAGVDVVLIARANFQDPSNPVIVTLNPWPELLFVGERFLALDGVLVCDEDVVVTEVFGAVD